MSPNTMLLLLVWSGVLPRSGESHRPLEKRTCELRASQDVDRISSMAQDTAQAHLSKSDNLDVVSQAAIQRDSDGGGESKPGAKSITLDPKRVMKRSNTLDPIPKSPLLAKSPGLMKKSKSQTTPSDPDPILIDSEDDGSLWDDSDENFTFVEDDFTLVNHNLFACVCFSSLSFLVGQMGFPQFYVAPFPSHANHCDGSNAGEASWRAYVRDDESLLPERQQVQTDFDMLINRIRDLWGRNQGYDIPQKCWPVAVAGPGAKSEFAMNKHYTQVGKERDNKDFRYACACEPTGQHGNVFLYGNPNYERMVATWGSSGGVRSKKDSKNRTVWFYPNGCTDMCGRWCEEVASKKVGCIQAVGWRDADDGGAPKGAKGTIEDSNHGEPLKAQDNGAWKKWYATWFATWVKNIKEDHPLENDHMAATTTTTTTAADTATAGKTHFSISFTKNVKKTEGKK